MLIISAAEFEAVPSLDRLKKIGVSFDFREAGIGPVHAATRACSFREEAKNRDVLILGSAGSFREFHKPYLVTAKKIFWMPTAERMGTAKNMEHLYPPVQVSMGKDLGLPSRSVLTSTSVSLNAEIAVSHLPEASDLVENMEAWPLAKALQPVAKSFTILLGISNQVGPEGSTQWSENFKEVAKLQADFLERNLNQFSPTRA